LPSYIPHFSFIQSIERMSIRERLFAKMSGAFSSRRPYSSQLENPAVRQHIHPKEMS
jgi:truncated hemoglobin YjbI